MTKRPEIIDLALNGELNQAIQQPTLPDFRQAACSGMDTEVFFAEDLVSVCRALCVCKPCPIKDTCGEWALVNAEFGVFGGMTPSERADRSSVGQVAHQANQSELKSELNFLLGAPAPEVALNYGVDVRTVARWRNILRVPLVAA